VGSASRSARCFRQRTPRPTARAPAHKPDLIELRKALGARESLFGVETLRAFADELRELYLGIDIALHRRPALRNTDGDPLEMHTLIFDLDAPEAAVDRLEDLGGAFAAPHIERDAAEALLAQIERDTVRMNPGLDPEFVRELRATCLFL
jgi:hypothetical protein